MPRTVEKEIKFCPFFPSFFLTTRRTISIDSMSILFRRYHFERLEFKKIGDGRRKYAGLSMGTRSGQSLQSSHLQRDWNSFPSLFVFVVRTTGHKNQKSKFQIKTFVRFVANCNTPRNPNQCGRNLQSSNGDVRKRHCLSPSFIA